MLEDESGRIRLVGNPVLTATLVTGVIMGALGMETANGDFEVIDYCFAGMAPQWGSEEEDMKTSSKRGILWLRVSLILIISTREGGLG